MVLQSCTKHEIITITIATGAEAEYILEQDSQLQLGTKFVLQLTPGITTLPIIAVPEPDYQSRRACGFFLARLVDARHPVFIGSRDQKSA